MVRLIHPTLYTGYNQFARYLEEKLSKAGQIVAGLGGASNIVEVEGCITRLRVEVRDPAKVDQAALKAAGAHGVVAQGKAVQVVVGPTADALADDIDDLL